MVVKHALKNVQAIELLSSNNERFFWSSPDQRQLENFDLDLSTKRLLSFRLPGHIERDASGKAKIISFTSPFHNTL